MILQGPSDDPTDLTREVDRVMSRPEFQYEKSWFDRVAEWINERLQDLGGGSGGPGSAPVFTGGAGSLVAWLMILLAVAAVIAVIVFVVRNRVARAEEDDTPDTDTQIEHRRSAKEWSSEASRHEAAGEWKLALRARYREMVRTLVDRQQLPDVAGRTTGELRVDLAGTTPGAGDAFDTASVLFELAWYADVPTGQEENAELRAAAVDVLAAPVQARSTDGDRVPA